MDLHFKSILIETFLFFLFLLFSCDDKCKVPKQNDERSDSLIHVAEDSLYSNKTLSRKCLEETLQSTSDSVFYYEVLCKYASTYEAFYQLDTAATLCYRVLAFCQKEPDSERINALQAKSYDIIGSFSAQIFDLDSAIVCFNKSLGEYKKSNNIREFPAIYLKMADAFINKGDIASCFFYNRKALLLSDSLNMIGEMTFPIFFGLSKIYMCLRDYKLSDHYFKMAFNHYEERSSGDKINFCDGRGGYYFKLQDYSKAQYWFNKGRQIALANGFEFYVNYLDLRIGDIYLDKGALDSATICYDRCHNYFSRHQNQTALFYILAIRVGMALKKNDLAQAHTFLRQNKGATGIESKIVFILDRYKQDFYTKSGNYRNAYKCQAKMMAQEDSIRSERLVKRIEELNMRYLLDKTLLRKDLLIRKQSDEVRTLRWSSSFLILLSLLAFLITAIVILHMKKQREIQWQKHFDQITKLRLQNIRNRISPHFIFNVLNRELSTMNDDKGEDMMALVKLLRMSLDMTEKLSIPLTQELSFVKGYIQLEQKSLGEDFQQKWVIDDRIKQEHFFVPPMIIQIPVENAIKHALRPKVGTKLLIVHVKMEDDGINIFIRDNGSGYDPFGVNHTNCTGTGMKVLRQTLHLLNSRNSKRIVFRMQNIVTDEICGASAEIFIPNGYKYEI
jgi:Putative regulator of cell autolysis